MTRFVAALVLLTLAMPASAEEPVLRLDVGETAVIPGQPVSLRLTVLVPTFLPDPPVWPSFEAPDLVVRVASTGPASERIDGATWSGVTRRYLIAPMLPGTVAVPASEVVVTWADPETNAPQRATLATEPLAIAGILPPGAEGLDPFVAADALTLEQTIEGAPEDMAPGAALTRTVVATIRGTAPMFLPKLLPPHDIEGLRAYPDDPVTAASEDRGVVSGSRTESVTLVAEGGGTGTLPPVAVAWYNLGTGEVETAALPSLAVSVAGPPAPTDDAARSDWRTLALVTAAGLLAVALVALSLRRLAPRLGTWVARHRADWLASEPHAWSELKRAVRARDHARLRPALDRWAARTPGADPRREQHLSAALAALGAARYGTGQAREADAWGTLGEVLPEIRRAARNRVPTYALPPLNPSA
jgi:hypothetical protein